MPELPEVRTVCKSLNDYFLNKKIKRLKIHNKKSLREFDIKDTEKIKNELVYKIYSIGKNIVMETTNYNFVIHLRMEGKFSKKEDSQAKHFIAEFELEDGNIIVFSDFRKFGTIDIFPKSIDLKGTKVIKKLAKEPWDIKYNELFNKLNKKNSKIKALLLNQEIICGLGNIYVDEVLYESKIHPNELGKNITLDDTKNILENSKKILDKAILMNGTKVKSFGTEKYKSGYQKFLKVHLRENQKCYFCQEKIIKFKVNGRGTYICPNEQKLKN